MLKYKGIVFTILSAIIFGITPILGKLTYQGGSNGITLSFLRAFLALPILFIILKVKKVSWKTNIHEFKKLFIAGLIGGSFTTITLYISYSYISVGMATTLHFIYPILITLACVLIFKEKVDIFKLLGLAFGTTGILFFIDRSASVNMFGIFIAIVSGFGYAFYVVYIDKSGLKNMYYFKLSFYICLVMTVCSGIYGVATQSIHLNMTLEAWIISFIVSLLVSVGALALFQLGVKYIGSSAASILSTLEPISSIVLGIIVFGEDISFSKILGFLSIIVSVIFIAMSQKHIAKKA